MLRPAICSLLDCTLVLKPSFLCSLYTCLLTVSIYFFQVTPLAIALMKDQMPCADYLLSLDNVDVNFPDDCGRTLLCQKLRSSTLDEQLLEKATFLVEKKGADVNKADIEQWTPVKIFVLKRNAFVCSLPDSSTDGFYVIYLHAFQHRVKNGMSLISGSHFTLLIPIHV